MGAEGRRGEEEEPSDARLPMAPAALMVVSTSGPSERSFTSAGTPPLVRTASLFVGQLSERDQSAAAARPAVSSGPESIPTRSSRPPPSRIVSLFTALRARYLGWMNDRACLREMI